MYANEKYQDCFPESVILEERPEAYQSCALRIGTYAVIRKVWKNTSYRQCGRNELTKTTGYFCTNTLEPNRIFPDFTITNSI